MTNVQIRIGMGEAFDRLSILQIKGNRLKDTKRATARAQHEVLALLLPSKRPPEYDALIRVNGALWDIEERLREFEPLFTGQPLQDLTNKGLGDFVYNARQVYKLNDERARLKQAIDRRFGCAEGEVKSYV